jgi:hypothetical protein
MKLAPAAVRSLVSVRAFLKSRPAVSVDLSWFLYATRGILAELDIECLEADRLVRCFRDLEEMRAAAAKRGHNRIAARTEAAIQELHSASLSHGGYIMWDGARYGVHFQNVWRTVVYACNAASYIVVWRGEENYAVIRQDTVSRSLEGGEDAEERATVLAVVAESRTVRAMHANHP